MIFFFLPIFSFSVRERNELLIAAQIVDLTFISICLPLWLEMLNNAVSTRNYVTLLTQCPKVRHAELTNDSKFARITLDFHKFVPHGKKADLIEDRVVALLYGF